MKGWPLGDVSAQQCCPQIVKGQVKGLLRREGLKMILPKQSP